MMREVVIDDQHVAALLHEILRDAGRGVGGDESKTRRVVAFGHDKNGVIHRAFFPQGCRRLRHRGRALTDGAINADHILVALIEDGVDRNGGLACLAVAQDQLTLPAPDRNEGIDDFQPGLKRHRNRRAIHDVRCRALDGPALAGGHRAVAIEWPTKRVDDAPQQTVADNHVHDPACALDFIASVQMPIFAEQHDAYFRLVDVEGHAEQIAGEFDQLIKAHAREPGHFGDAGGDAGDRAYLSRYQLRREFFPRLA